MAQASLSSSFGPQILAEGVHFHAWVPEARHVEISLETSGGAEIYPMEKSPNGFFSIFLPGIRPGQLYRYKIDGKGPFPDPASRFQPQGVHGPSQVVDSSAYKWSDGLWLSQSHVFRTIYELHLGTFTAEGTYAGAEAQLSYLKDLGVDAIELMPLADFPGNRNWGYDGVDLFAPARCYGSPDDLRRFIDKAHKLDLGVLVDVVYNHFGPDGNYMGNYTPYFVSKKHKSDWGDAVNLDDIGSESVRDFFIENALYWIRDFHVDGLRLDATHALQDDSPEHFLAQLTREVKENISRPITLIAEDYRNLNRIVQPKDRNGFGFDAIWADDFHHTVRRFTAGDRQGYYGDFHGTTEEIAKALSQGWLYEGQFSQSLNAPRGTSAQDLKPENFVFCIQNHDQIGNRAMGERLNHQIDENTYRAASALLLLSPHRVLLFMGQEWAASSPFLYFTDHHEELGRLVTEGRRREFSAFSEFNDPKKRDLIPDPQSPDTFKKSRLHHEEKVKSPHLRTLLFYQALLRLRKDLESLHLSYRFSSIDNSAVVAGMKGSRVALLSVVHLRSGGSVNLKDFTPDDSQETWDVVMKSDQDIHLAWPEIHFSRPGAMVLRRSG